MTAERINRDDLWKLLRSGHQSLVLAYFTSSGDIATQSLRIEDCCSLIEQQLQVFPRLSDYAQTGLVSYLGVSTCALEEALQWCDQRCRQRLIPSYVRIGLALCGVNCMESVELVELGTNKCSLAIPDHQIFVLNPETRRVEPFGPVESVA
jgi:hypothetical protein